MTSSARLLRRVADDDHCAGMVEYVILAEEGDWDPAELRSTETIDVGHDYRPALGGWRTVLMPTFPDATPIWILDAAVRYALQSVGCEDIRIEQDFRHVLPGGQDGATLSAAARDAYVLARLAASERETIPAPAEVPS